MADDTREKNNVSQESQYETREIEEPHYIAPETPRPRRKKPMHAYPETQAGKMWKALQPDEPVNTMPGSAVNTAGGRPKEVSWRDAFNFGGSISDLMKIHQTPCARDALLVGLGSGGALGGTSFVLTGTSAQPCQIHHNLTEEGISRTMLSCNLAVGSFVMGAVGMYAWCDQRRRQEAQNIALTMRGLKAYNEKQSREEKEEKLRTIAEEAKRTEEERNKSWYKKIW